MSGPVGEDLAPALNSLGRGCQRRYCPLGTATGWCATCLDARLMGGIPFGGLRAKPDESGSCGQPSVVTFVTNIRAQTWLPPWHPSHNRHFFADGTLPSASLGHEVCGCSSRISSRASRRPTSLTRGRSRSDGRVPVHPAIAIEASPHRTSKGDLRCVDSSRSSSPLRSLR
jgi:hypothetical protein